MSFCGFVVAAAPYSAAAAADAASCANSKTALGVSRIIEIDVSGGPMFGAITRRKSERSFLKDKEIVLTFDDGPAPSITNSILKTLDRFCTKATFFEVGRMAITYPQTVKRVLSHGHTLASHTWSHPLHLNRMKPQKAFDQIEEGFAAVTMAAGQPIAPFFRFPGLNDSRLLLDYLQKRRIGSFTVDVVSDDSFINDPIHLANLTLRRVRQHHGGILLFHDIKHSTARALPHILSILKARGYRVVHLVPKTKYKPLHKYDARLAPILAKVMKRIEMRARAKHAVLQTASAKPTLLPFYGTLGAGKYAGMKYLGPPVTLLAPAPRNRLRKPPKTGKGDNRRDNRGAGKIAQSRPQNIAKKPAAAATAAPRHAGVQWRAIPRPAGLQRH